MRLTGAAREFAFPAAEQVKSSTTLFQPRPGAERHGLNQSAALQSFGLFTSGRGRRVAGAQARPRPELVPGPGTCLGTANVDPLIRSSGRRVGPSGERLESIVPAGQRLSTLMDGRMEGSPPGGAVWWASLRPLDAEREAAGCGVVDVGQDRFHSLATAFLGRGPTWGPTDRASPLQVPCVFRAASPFATMFRRRRGQHLEEALSAASPADPVSAFVAAHQVCVLKVVAVRWRDRRQSPAPVTLSNIGGACAGDRDLPSTTASA